MPTCTQIIRYVAPLSLLLAAGCASTAVEERVEQSDTAKMAEMNVKGALLKEEDVWSAAIRVIYDGEAIRLDGFVADEEERQRALKAARQAEPELEIIDELEVWSG